MTILLIIAIIMAVSALAISASTRGNYESMRNDVYSHIKDIDAEVASLVERVEKAEAALFNHCSNDLAGEALAKAKMAESTARKALATIECFIHGDNDEDGEFAVSTRELHERINGLDARIKLVVGPINEMLDSLEQAFKTINKEE